MEAVRHARASGAGRGDARGSGPGRTSLAPGHETGGASPRVLALLVLGFGGFGALHGVDLRAPGNHQGYEPAQPIAFSHRLHAGDLDLDCRYCHYAADRSRHAGIPPAGLCMNCHRHVTASFDAVLEERLAAERDGREPRPVVSAGLARLYDALGLGPDLAPDPARTPRPIEWVRVHNLPDFVCFDHSLHVNRGLACEQCHGPVRSMERLRQESDLSMGWCLDCHRTSPARAADPAGPSVSTDCASCHF